MYTTKLTEAYGSFFSKAADFAISPYTVAFMDSSGFSRNDNTDPAWILRLIVGIPVCVTLTVIPVLPILTAVTATLAIVGAFIAALSALVAYPIASMMDACSDSSSSFSPSASFYAGFCKSLQQHAWV